MIFLRNKILSLLYRMLIKPFFFLNDPELVHNRVLEMGGALGKHAATRKVCSLVFGYHNSILEQTMESISFTNPIGLAAGFDYNAQLPEILPSVGFGFNTVGTITNMAYEGNPSPMLGRLPKSKSLLVNKGFKNNGAEYIAEKLKQFSLGIPLGISIGRTNSAQLKTVNDSIADIVAAFSVFEREGVRNSYYELNISCPNLLFATESFSDVQNLEFLLNEIDTLQVKKPIFIKMPLEKSNEDAHILLEKIIEHPVIKGVIFGNLQKNRKDPSLDPVEVLKFERGYFSGKPCEKRSNELIQLAHKGYGRKLIVIGCGGVFSAQDAYTKIKLGASLIQMITGIIYEGPQVVSEINRGLVELLKKDGYSNISQAVGVDNQL